MIREYRHGAATLLMMTLVYVIVHGQQGSITTPPTQPASDQSSIVGRWQLERIEYGEDKTVTPQSPEKYWVEFFHGGTLVAQLDCTRGRGSYKISGSTIAIEPILSTLMACGEGSVVREFTQVLQTATSFRRADDTLALSMPKNTGTMHLKRLP
jgi:heat shock protein HslJ